MVGSTVFSYDGLQIAFMMGNVCADIYMVGNYIMCCVY